MEKDLSPEEEKKVRRRIKQIWYHMIARCYNTEWKTYNLYGGRGISVCDEWRESAEAFIEWALSNGYDPHVELRDCTLDRKDNDGNYEPSNCRWISMEMQSRNRRNTLRIEYNGENISWQDFADQTKITSPKFVRRRVKIGMPADEIIREWGYRTDKEHYMTEEEAKRFYKTNSASIARWMKDGRLQGVKTRGGVYILKGQEVERRRKITPEEREEIYQLHLQGKTTKELMEIFGISRAGIQQTVRKMKQIHEPIQDVINA